jgi:RND family efflux transporter MFP subunit
MSAVALPSPAAPLPPEEDDMKIETLPSPSAVRRHRWRVPVIAVAVLGLAGGGWALLRPQPTAAHASEPAKAKAGAPQVLELAATDVASIAARSLALRLPLSGSLAPLSQATVKSKVSGQVELTTVQEGMAVTAGQVLARIDLADLRARLAQQQAALDEAQAKLSLATKNEASSLALLKQKFIAQTAYDATQNSVDLARANVKAAAAAVQVARIAMNDGVIRAPISGIVSKRHVQAGEKLAPDMPVYTIVNLSELTLEAQVPASEIPRIEVGQQVRFNVDGFQQREFTGKVARINPTTETGSRYMLVYVAVPNADGALRGGMFAKGSLVTARSAVAPLVPLAALRTEQGRQVVYTIVQDKVAVQPVALGMRNDDEGYAEVTAGLAPGASVIIAKLDGLKAGSPVKPPPRAAAPQASQLAQKD